MLMTFKKKISFLLENVVILLENQNFFENRNRYKIYEGSMIVNANKVMMQCQL